MKFEPELFDSYNRFFKEGILLDNGPLMLLMYGSYDKNLLIKIDCTEEQFNALSKFIDTIKYLRRGRMHNPKMDLQITPQVFTEFFQNSQEDVGKANIKNFFAIIGSSLAQIEENNVSKEKIHTNDKIDFFQIGELSLICLRDPIKHNRFHVIIHNDKDIDNRYERDKNILTIHIEKILPWYYTQLAKS